MRIGKSHPQWQSIIDGWRQTQHELRRQMTSAPLDPLPRFVAGADCAFSKDGSTVFAAAVIYDREVKRIIEVRHATAPADVPYIPTFLSFREAPALTKAITALQHPFGVICFDGQGIAHPRRCGLATHMGVTLNIPAIGVAKTRLIGTFAEPAKAGGSFSPLMDDTEQIGVVLRTRDGINPLFISIGNRVDLPSAVALLMSCVKHRIPEPTRQADIEVDKLKNKS